MKTVYAVICATLLLWASAVTAGDLQQGIAGMKWGDPVMNLSRFKQILSKGDVNLYVDTEGVYTLAGVEASRAVFGFYQDRLFAVFLAIASPEVFADVRRALKSQLGDPETTMTLKNPQKIYKWKRGKIRVKLKEYTATGEMKLAFYYTPLSRKLNKVQLEEMSDPSRFRLFPITPGVRPRAIPVLNF